MGLEIVEGYNFINLFNKVFNNNNNKNKNKNRGLGRGFYLNQVPKDKG